MQRTRDRLCWLFALVMGMATSGLLAEETNRERSPYHAYAVGAGHADYYGGGTNADLVVPLWSNDTNLFFTDLRSRWNSSDRTDLSAGLAFRHLTDTDQIFGGYTFFDHQESPEGFDYQQGMFGLEFMSLGWEARANAYLTTRTAYQVGPGRAEITGGRLYVIAPFEAAFATADFEVGALLKGWMDGAIEWRGYAGGYYARRDVVGFDKLAGPRLRTELRLYGLPWLGHGARLVAEGTYQWDEARGSQGLASLAVRMPLSFGERRRPTRIERRMLDRIVRSPGILTESQSHIEPAVTVDGNPILAVAEIDADTQNPGALISGLGEYSIVTLSGSAGDFQLTEPFAMNNHQALLGGGTEYLVKGKELNQLAVYRVPGTRPRLLGPGGSADTVTLPRMRGVVSGLDIIGGRNGLAGDGVSHATIVGNHISDAVASEPYVTGHGIYLRNAQDTISMFDNVLEANESSGLFVDTSASQASGVTVELIGNVAIQNGEHGIRFGDGIQGTSAHNYLIENGNTGFWVDGAFTGDIIQNTAVSNTGGITVNSNVNGNITQNTLTSNRLSGILIGDDVSGDVASNLSEGSQNIGIRVGGNVLGNLVDNVLRSNGGGVYVVRDVLGDVASNTAMQNDGPGIQIDGDVGGDLSDNLSAQNRGTGIRVGDVVMGSILRNTVTENQFYGIMIVEGADGDVIGNTTNDNREVGLQVKDHVGGSVRNNESSGNTRHGIDVRQVAGDVNGNRAHNNGIDDGYRQSTAYGLLIIDWGRGEVAENDLRHNKDEGLFLGLRPTEDVTLRQNVLVGNNGPSQEVRAVASGDSDAYTFITLKDNISRNDLSGSDWFDYAVWLGERIEFIDAGGNVGKIQPPP
ncbi:MAG: right-handed parallel beta-helix repeat-containing protein [Planctomycetaceae bacterium]|nr:right-handed parallel beta-helix repeat-containing protein [Planctomycetaceae bacterium]